jgi:hypothetical protein
MRKLAPLGAVSITLVLAVNFQAAPSGNILTWSRTARRYSTNQPALRFHSKKPTSLIHLNRPVLPKKRPTQLRAGPF